MSQPACNRIWLCLLALLLAPRPGALQEDLPAWLNPADLADGTILVQLDADDRFREHIEIAALVDVPARSVWDVLLDCASTPDYVPHVQTCELVETLDDGRAQIFKQRVKFAWFLPRFDHVFRLDYEPYRSIRIHRVEGPFERLEGQWRLVPRSERQTLVLYSLDFVPGLPLPRFIVGNTLTRDLPEVMREVRTRAEQGR
jgi:ribosome-associated toxin RatA of RatAB toxin-antitoxin module